MLKKNGLEDYQYFSNIMRICNSSYSFLDCIWSQYHYSLVNPKWRKLTSEKINITLIFWWKSTLMKTLFLMFRIEHWIQPLKISIGNKTIGNKTQKIEKSSRNINNIFYRTIILFGFCLTFGDLFLSCNMFGATC